MSNKEVKIRPVIFLVIMFLVPNILFLLVYGMSHYFSSDSFNAEFLILKKEGIKIVFNIGDLDKLEKKGDRQYIADEIKRILKNSKAGELQTQTCNEVECEYTIYGAEADRLRQIVTPFLKGYPKRSGSMYMIYNLSNLKEQIRNDLY